LPGSGITRLLREGPIWIDRHFTADKPSPLADDCVTGRGMRVRLEHKLSHADDQNQNES
jgi:hypothetical protein